MAQKKSRTGITSDMLITVMGGWQGVNTEDDTTQITDTQGIDCLNIVQTKETKKRGGYAKVNSTELTGSTGIYGLMPYYKSGGSDELLVASHTTVQVLDTGTGVFTQPSGGTGLTTNEYTIGKQFKNILVITKTSDAPRKYNGSTVALLGGSPPTCKYQEVHKNYHFLAGNSTYQSRLYWSNVSDNETWSALDFVDVYPDDGDIITGLHSTLDALIIFKRYNVYVLYGDTPTYVEGLTLWRIKKASTDTGAPNQQSIAQINKNLVYPSSNLGVQAFGGSISSETIEFDSLSSKLMSKDITPTYSALNLSRISQACAVNFDYKYILSVPNASSTTNNYNLVYDYLNNCWYFWNLPANCFATFRTSGVDTLYFGSPSNGFVYKYTPSIYTDAGTAINAYYYTKDYNMGSSTKDKEFYKFYVTLNKSTDYALTVEPVIDMETSAGSYSIAALSTGFTLGTSVLGTDRIGTTTTHPSDAQIMNNRGKFIRFKFSNNVNNENFRLRDLSLYYKNRSAL